jgi:hypothetical protein
VRDMHEPFLNPTGRDYGLGDLPGRHAVLTRWALPEEWWSQFLQGGKRRLGELLTLLVFAVPLGLALRRRPPPRAAMLLAVPLGLAVLLMSAGLLVGNWDLFYPRYAYAYLAPWALFAGLLLPARAAGRLAGAGTLAALVVWAGLAQTTPYTA